MRIRVAVAVAVMAFAFDAAAGIGQPEVRVLAQTRSALCTALCGACPSPNAPCPATPCPPREPCPECPVAPPETPCPECPAPQPCPEPEPCPACPDAGSNAEEVATANRWAKERGYEWLRTRGDFVRAFRLEQLRRPGLDPVVYAAELGYDSPMATCTYTWTVARDEAHPVRTNPKASGWNTAMITYNGIEYHVAADPDADPARVSIETRCITEKVPTVLAWGMRVSTKLFP